MTARTWITVGAVFAALGVALGAFGAHGLEERLVEAGQLENWHTGVRYQMWHALALILLGLVARSSERPGAGRPAGLAFTLGILAFSGSLYALCLGVPAGAIWFVTPLGGLLLIVGWVLFAGAARR